MSINIKTNGGGVDIASRRMSKTSKLLIKFLLETKKGGVILDLGGGSGFFSIAIAFLHYNVYLYDIFFEPKLQKNINYLKKEFDLKIYPEECDLSNADYGLFPKDVIAVHMGYFFHYLKYNDAKKLLKILHKNMLKGGRIFISVSGIYSELSNGYDITKPIINRFDYLSIDNQKKFQLKKKVTLYSMEELGEIFNNNSWTTIKINKNLFGNIMGVFEKN